MNEGKEIAARECDDVWSRPNYAAEKAVEIVNAQSQRMEKECKEYREALKQQEEEALQKQRDEIKAAEAKIKEKIEAQKWEEERKGWQNWDDDQPGQTSQQAGGAGGGNGAASSSADTPTPSHKTLLWKMLSKSFVETNWHYLRIAKSAAGWICMHSAPWAWRFIRRFAVQHTFCRHVDVMFMWQPLTCIGKFLQI